MQSRNIKVEGGSDDTASGKKEHRAGSGDSVQGVQGNSRQLVSMDNRNLALNQL